MIFGKPGFDKKWVTLALSSLVLFSAVGLIFYNERGDRQKGFEALLDSAQFSDAFRLYGSLFGTQRFDIIYFSNNATKIWCFGGEKLSISQKACNDKKIVIDEHAAASIVLGSYNLKGVFLSELIMGHIKIEGFNLLDIHR